MRHDHEPPPVLQKPGWQYHHVGIPTTVPHAGERYLPQFKLYTSGFATSPYGVEWMRYEADCTLPEIIRTVAHVAFRVENLDAALEGAEVLFPPCEPSNGVRSAMILHDGAPVELLEFTSQP